MRRLMIAALSALMLLYQRFSGSESGGAHSIRWLSLLIGPSLAGAQVAASARPGAPLSIWKERQWRAPYYWVAFVLQGKWK